MRDLYFYSISSGVLFGIWPLLMNKSGLDGFASAAILGGISFITMLPVAFASGQMQQVSITPQLGFVLVSGIMSGVGVLLFNTMLAKVSTREVGAMILIMIMVQISIPAIYQMVQSGEFSPKEIGGIACAFTAAYLLA